MRENLIYKPFNGVFFVIFGIYAAIWIVLSLFMKKKDEGIKRRVLAGLMFFTLAGFFVYKYALSLDVEYSMLKAEAGLGNFSWWGELPLQLCNINTILIPIAMASKKRDIESFCFFVGPIGAGLALLMPGIGFNGYSILLPRMIGFYFTHFMVFFGGIAVCSFGIFKPKFGDIPKTLVFGVILLLIVSGINILMRVTGLYAYSNYLFSMNTEGNPILNLFYSLIPVPVLYEIPCFGILAAYMYALSGVFALFEKKKEKISV